VLLVRKIYLNVWLLAISLALLFPGLIVSLQAEEEVKTLKETSKAFSEIVKRTAPAVVYIQVEKSASSGATYPFNDPFDQFNDDFFEHFFKERFPKFKERKQPTTGQGSGFIISEDGYILTNNHVVGDSDKITVKLKDGREMEAKLIGADPKSDVAVIKIDATSLPTIKLGNSDKLEVGEWVIAIGNPFGLVESVTVGIVSAKGRSTVGITDYENFIQTDAAINPGNSGGPLLNLDGEAIGMNTAIFSRSGGYMGIGFSIPINMAISIKDQLIKTGKVIRGFLGIFIQDNNKDLAESFGITQDKGIIVSDVTKDSPADKSEIKQGDIILKLNDKPVESVSEFRNTISLTEPGKKVKLEIFRDGQTLEKEVEVGTLPDNIDEAQQRPQQKEDMSSTVGLTVQELTPDLAQRFGYIPGEGVVVSNVEYGSPAENAGIKVGALITSIDKKPVKTVAEFTKELNAALSKKKSAVLAVKSEGHSRFVVLKK
jgi:serine protease Do